MYIHSALWNRVGKILLIAVIGTSASFSIIFLTSANDWTSRPTTAYVYHCRLRSVAEAARFTRSNMPLWRDGESARNFRLHQQPAHILCWLYTRHRSRKEHYNTPLLLTQGTLRLSANVFKCINIKSTLCTPSKYTNTSILFAWQRFIDHRTSCSSFIHAHPALFHRIFSSILDAGNSVFS